MRKAVLPPVEAYSPFYEHDPPSTTAESNLCQFIAGSYFMENKYLGLIWVPIDSRPMQPLYGHA
ncbi:MAG: hypothetical protein OEY86_04325 [Nitrospira sp.]|nr:hypothetical protein [Nitrospira sp.]